MERSRDGRSGQGRRRRTWCGEEVEDENKASLPERMRGLEIDSVRVQRGRTLMC